MEKWTCGSSARATAQRSARSGRLRASASVQATMTARSQRSRNAIPIVPARARRPGSRRDRARRLGRSSRLAVSRRGARGRAPARTRGTPGARRRAAASRTRLPEGESHRVERQCRRDGVLGGERIHARDDRRVRERAVKDARAQFGKTAAAYVSSATHASGEDLERLIAVAAPRSHERALDLGCGVGHTLCRIAPLVAFVVGADATLEMMQAGRASVVTASNAAFAQSDAAALPFPDATFDLVTCRLAAHHFTDAAGAFREVARVLRPGGRSVP